MLMPVPKLSVQQRATVDWVRKRRGSLILQSRAGTGKSFTIVNGICRTIYDEQPSAECAVMAYNKDAGDELAGKLLDAGMDDWRRMKAGTCHSFGFAAFRKKAPNVRVDEQKVMKIVRGMALLPDGKTVDEESPYHRCAKPIRKTVSMAKQMAFGLLKSTDVAETWLDLIEAYTLDDELPEGYAPLDLARMARKVLKASFAADYDVIDFDDMIIAPLIHGARMFPKDYVIVDEAQDTNPARRALAFAMLKPRVGRFVAVGDDRQAIYGFTGADSDSLDIIRDATKAETLMLTETRRCPKAVVELAKNLVPDYKALDDAPEGVVREINYTKSVERDATTGLREDYPWFQDECLGTGDAILCRNTKPLVQEAYALIKAGIPCIVEGRDFGGTLESLATRWRSVKSITVLGEKLTEYCAKEMDKHLAKDNDAKAEAVEERVDCLKTIIDKVRSEGGKTVEDVVAAIRRLFGDTTDENAPQDVVVLCTLHRSKGREWRRVFHLGRLKLLPSRHAETPEQLRQEENLEYVGFTRAMQEYVDVVM